MRTSNNVKLARTDFGHAPIGHKGALCHHGPITSVAATGNWIATGGYDNQVLLHDAAAGRTTDRASCDHLVNRVSFGRTGRLLAVASSDWTGRIYTTDGGALLLRAVLGGHRDDVEDIAISANGTLVATASRDHMARIYSIDGKLKTVLQGHASDVLSVAWGNSDRTLLSSGDDGTVRRWDVAQGREIDRLVDGGVETDALVSAPAGWCAWGDDAGRITIVWLDGRRSTIAAHDAGIKRLVLSSTGLFLMSLSYDRTVAIWEVASGEFRLLHRLTMPPQVWSRSATFLDSRRILFGSFGCGWAEYDLDRGWDLSRATPYASLNAVAAHEGAVYAIGDSGILHRDGIASHRLGSSCNFLRSFAGRLLAGGQTGELFDALSGTLLVHHRSPLNCATTYQVDGHDVAAVGTYTGELLFLRAHQDGNLEDISVLPMHANAIKGVAAGDNGMLFSVDATGAAGWLPMNAPQHGGEVLTGAHDRIANGCVALPGGRFASVGRDLCLRLWDGRRAKTHQTLHRHSIKSIAASPDGAWLATADYRGIIGLFEVAKERWLGTSRPTAAGIACLVPDASGRGFLAASYDGAVHAVTAAD